MKLRDKQTGKIRDFEFVAISDDWRRDDEIANYAYRAPVLVCRSIDQLNEEWEDYAPKEPLIKDEKIREAVRAWAVANRDVSEVIYEYDTSKAYCEIIDNQSEARIRFNFLFINELSPNELYTIDELCGEEEE